MTKQNNKDRDIDNSKIKLEIMNIIASYISMIVLKVRVGSPSEILSVELQIAEEILSKLKENEVVLLEGRLQWNDTGGYYTIGGKEIFWDKKSEFKKLAKLDGKLVKAAVIEE